MKKKTAVLLTASFILFVLFVIFTLMVREDMFTRFDYNLSVKIQDYLPDRIYPLFAWGTILGKVEVTSLFLLVLLLMQKNISSLLVLGIFLGSHIIEFVGKLFLTHPGPTIFFQKTVTASFLPSDYVQPGASYPSGHAMRAVFLSIVLASLIYNSKISTTAKLLLYIVVFAFPLLMGLAKIGLGAHWTADVIGGLLFGSSMGLFSLIFLKNQHRVTK